MSASPAPVAGALFRRPIGGVDFVARPTGVSEVVTIVGSLAAGDAFSPPTTPPSPCSRPHSSTKAPPGDKFALAELLAGIGATISSAPTDSGWSSPPAACAPTPQR
ncbi:MAG: hypothetical protein IPL39_13665 [Opitutaceae bacterium]|nr:hypothetical protein [Opitutaceae bacterium]